MLQEFKILIYVFLLASVFIHFTYNSSLNSCQCLLKNYTKINKFSNPNDYEGKIVFISSSKPKYQIIYNKEFNMNFTAAFVQKNVKRCRLVSGRNNHVDSEWLPAISKDNSVYSSFQIGNFSIDTESFDNSMLQLQAFIPSEEMINNFNKSSAAENYYYLDRGYFFDKSFPQKSLKRRLSDCTLHDKFVKFKIMNYNSLSILGVVENGEIKYFNYYSIDFSGIFNGKISLNEYVSNLMKNLKKQVYFLGFAAVLILIILVCICDRINFAIFAVAFMIVSIVNIKAFCLYYFPIRFKPMFATTISILMSLLFFYSNRIPEIINVLLLN